MASRTFHINFMGDVMLGRLIDQLLPAHVHAPDDEATVKHVLKRRPDLQSYTAKSPWGTTLPLVESGDLNIINLETSATTYRIKWPNKTFNYRMHPNNLAVLKVANIDYAGLANNHTLDFSEEGLVETVNSVKEAGLAFAGAGVTREEALRPATLHLPNTNRASSTSTEKPAHQVHVWAASDHPDEWFDIPNFHSITYNEETKNRLKSLIKENGPASSSLKIFSVHWGPNYEWQPRKSIQSLARYMIDDCGIDIVHGHSSHHVQGAERYHGKLIIYGCGDFVDDYAEVPEFRNNLSALWRVAVKEDSNGLKLDKLEIFPTRIQNFKAQLLNGNDADHEWVKRTVTKLSEEFGTEVEGKPGSQGQMIINLE